MPAELAAALDAPGEVVGLTTEPGRPGWCINLASDFLETAARVLAAEPRIGSFTARDLYLKRGTLDAAVQRTFAWLNAKVTMADTRATTAEYHTWWFRASITSEDRWETRLRVSINAASGVEVPLPDPLELWALRPGPSAAPNGSFHVPAGGGPAGAAGPGVGGRLLPPHGCTSVRRPPPAPRVLRRTGAGGPAQAGPRRRATRPRRLAAKKRAVDSELRRKLAELDERYAMEATLEPLVLVRTEIPVMAVDLLVQRKRARRKHVVYWNPLLKQIEPLCCSRCGGGALLCDLH